MILFAVTCLTASVSFGGYALLVGSEVDSSPYILFGVTLAAIGFMVLAVIVQERGCGYLLDYAIEARRPWRWLLYLVILPIAFSFSLIGYPMDGTSTKAQVKVTSKV